MLPPQLIELIKRFEGLRLKAYKCSASVWTIGYGHTGSNVTEGLEITQEQAEEILLKDIQERLDQVLKVSPIIETLDDDKISAIVDFVFNLGIGNYRRSTFRQRVDEENWEEAAKECKKWNKAGGKVLRGLVLRREAEAELLLADAKKKKIL
ncbi:lysozyme [Candidatus Liberibacter americanus]|uniref:Lysozyme n=1 Tax=Candidatus Liberibacter americanus str. Sao Paulo TaxID=1261131 RepID=U6B8B2_9HYPH|nr:lysozyme [Candidatus Liberibacter americanus]AHA27972.1 Phage-related lysozyme [Candidatus Liberibacter americanus str. Sao Paulo]EMS35871.1 phage-related lysozyme [Candidatus Liberibacter americanus PW_SP]